MGVNAGQCRITAQDIADMAGIPISTVRRHRADGWFSMGDPKSVVKYVMGQMMLSELEPKVERR